MSVKIEFYGETAKEAFEELKTFANIFSCGQPQLSVDKISVLEADACGNEDAQENEATFDDGSPDIDAHGWPWNADLHASTRGTTKDGLWRMKIGVTRPGPKPGFPKDTGIEQVMPSTSAPVSTVTEMVPDLEQTAEDDEFAAFRVAAAKTDAEDASAKASVPSRKWTDADLGALCNQAATKLGDPAPVKAIITEYVPEGETPHSRNIPVNSRAAFVAAIEAKAGIEFAG